jgi:hypothetical protein
MEAGKMEGAEDLRNNSISFRCKKQVLLLRKVSNMAKRGIMRHDLSHP